MPKPTPAEQTKPHRDIYRTITDKIIAAIEQSHGEPNERPARTNRAALNAPSSNARR